MSYGCVVSFGGIPSKSCFFLLISLQHQKETGFPQTNPSGFPLTEQLAYGLKSFGPPSQKSWRQPIVGPNSGNISGRFVVLFVCFFCFCFSDSGGVIWAKSAESSLKLIPRAPPPASSQSAVWICPTTSAIKTLIPPKIFGKTRVPLSGLLSESVTKPGMVVFSK